MTTVKARPYLFWCGLALVFILALVPRLVYPVSRYMLWYDRSVRFWDALLAGDFQSTYQQYHPGVTTMWIAGLGLRAYMVAQGWSSNDLLHPPPMMSGPQGAPAQMGVVALSFAIAACTALVYVLLNRLTNWLVALSAGWLLALNPFHLAHSKLIHVDGLLSSLMLVSAIFLIVYLQEDRLVHLVLSGIFAGLAGLTKSSAGFLVPYTVLVTVLHQFTQRHTGEKATETLSWSQDLLHVGRSLALWALVAACTFTILWPAMWVTPKEALSAVVKNAVMHVERPHPQPIFFGGQVIGGDPGLLYYLASLAWKTTLITLPAICAAIVLLVWRHKDADNEHRWVLLYVLIYAGGFLLTMTLGNKKWARYILPAFVALDVVAAWGLVQVTRAIGRCGRLQSRTLIPPAIVAIALIIQAVTVLRHHPYYGTHHNLLLGGSRVAQHVLHLGDQAEGLDLAARFLNDRPGAERITVATQDVATEMLRDNFVGHVETINDPTADYRLFFINTMQRRIGFGDWDTIWKAYQPTEPVWSVSFDGVVYAWLYRAYPDTPDLFDIGHRLDVKLGDHIRLLGYRLSTDEITAGNGVTVTLFWQSDAPMIEDNHVFVHLLNPGGDLIAQHDGTPVRGDRPTWSWQEEEVIQDEHRLVLDGNTPARTYTLSIGMYEYTSMTRLPVTEPCNRDTFEDRIVLQELQVIVPSQR